MRRSLSLLRQGLLGSAVVVSLAFGANQAFGTPEAAARDATCPWSPGPTFSLACDNACQEKGFDYGYCDSGRCICRSLAAS